jgi:hypothetical protein
VLELQHCACLHVVSVQALVDINCYKVQLQRCYADQCTCWTSNAKPRPTLASCSPLLLLLLCCAVLCCNPTQSSSSRSPYIDNTTVSAEQLLAQPLLDFGLGKYREYQRLADQGWLRLRISETNSL